MSDLIIKLLPILIIFPLVVIIAIVILVSIYYQELGPIIADTIIILTILLFVVTPFFISFIYFRVIKREYEEI